MSDTRERELPWGLSPKKGSEGVLQSLGEEGWS